MRTALSAILYTSNAKTVNHKWGLDMKTILTAVFGVFLAMQLTTAGAAERAQKKHRGVTGMSEKELIEMARSAAPARISADASVMVQGPDGKLKEVAKGTNGFTCIPDTDAQEVADPMCGNAAAMQWATDLLEGRPAPTNTEPGVAYMAKGGWHWEKDGKILMDAKTPGAKRVREPSHWMIFWPFKAKETLLPVMPGKFGTYIMWEGTPYAHLMIYQNPKKVGR